jgi:hypothetical protein
MPPFQHVNNKMPSCLSAPCSLDLPYNSTSNYSLEQSVKGCLLMLSSHLQLLGRWHWGQPWLNYQHAYDERHHPIRLRIPRQLCLLGHNPPHRQVCLSHDAECLRVAICSILAFWLRATLCLPGRAHYLRQVCFPTCCHLQGCSKIVHGTIWLLENHPHTSPVLFPAQTGAPIIFSSCLLYHHCNFLHLRLHALTLTLALTRSPTLTLALNFFINLYTSA